MSARDLAEATDTELLGAVRSSASAEERLAAAQLRECVDPVPPGLVERCQSLLDLRALTIRWPHVAAIVCPAPQGCVPKRTEIRSWPLSHFGTVAIHAGKAWDPPSAQGDAMRDWVAANGLDGIDLAYCEGKILAVADLTGFHPASGTCCPPWGVPDHGQFHWILDNVRPLAEPVACRGQLGLWRPAADTLAAVLRQITAVAS